MNKDLLVRGVKSTVKTVETQLNRKVHSVYLTGSALYGVSTPESDFDFKVYVYPTFSDLCFNEKLSKEVAINENNVEHVSVRDVRFQYDELNKLSFNSAHLLHPPLLGKRLFTEEQLAQVLEERKDNFLFSLAGVSLSESKNENSGKKLSRMLLLENMFTAVLEDKFTLNYFFDKDSSKEVLVRENFYRYTDFAKLTPEELMLTAKDFKKQYRVDCKKLENVLKNQLLETVKTFYNVGKEVY